MNAEEKSSPTARRQERTLVFSLIAASALIAFWGFDDGHSLMKTPMGQVGYAVGYIALPTCITWGLCHVLFWRKLRRQRKAQTFFILFAIGLCSVLVSGNFYERQSDKMAARFIEEASAVHSSNLENAGQGNGAKGRLDTRPTVGGQLGQVDVLLRSLYNEILDTDDAYSQKLAAAGWEGILTPSRLARDVDFSQSKAIIARANEIVAAQLKVYEDIIEQGKRQLREQKGGERLVLSFEAGVKSTWRVVETMYEYEKEIVAFVESAILFLERTKGTWKVEDDMLLFEKGADLESYQDIIQKVKDVVAEQEKLFQAVARSIQACL